MRNFSIRAAALATLTALAGVGASSDAAILVTEFLPDPSGTDVDREWFEIYNTDTVNSVNLSGYAAGDGTDPASTAAGEGMGVFPTGSIIGPGEAWVIAANANGFNSLYGFLPDFEFANNTSTLGNNAGVPDMPQKAGWGGATSTLALSNNNDDVGILPPDATAASFTFLDGTNHGLNTNFFTGAPTLGSNQSYERVPADQDTNSASDWVVRLTGTATPGAVTVPEPATLSLVGLAGLGLLGRRRRSVR